MVVIFENFDHSLRYQLVQGVCDLVEHSVDYMDRNPSANDLQYHHTVRPNHSLGLS